MKPFALRIASSNPNCSQDVYEQNWVRPILSLNISYNAHALIISELNALAPNHKSQCEILLYIISILNCVNLIDSIFMPINHFHEFLSSENHNDRKELWIVCRILRIALAKYILLSRDWKDKSYPISTICIRVANFIKWTSLTCNVLNLIYYFSFYAPSRLSSRLRERPDPPNEYSDA